MSTDAHKTDRRIRRTQDALKRALVELVVEKGFEATNVGEIAERANVGRSTFYAHYADKEDLLQGSIDDLRGHLQAAAEAKPDAADVHPALAFCLPMLEHAYEHRPLFFAMVGRKSGDLMQEFFHDMWVDFVRSGWTGADEIAVQAIAGGFGATVSWWITHAPELSPREVFDRFSALVTPALAGR